MSIITLVHVHGPPDVLLDHELSLLRQPLPHFRRPRGHLLPHAQAVHFHVKPFQFATEKRNKNMSNSRNLGLNINHD